MLVCVNKEKLISLDFLATQFQFFLASDGSFVVFAAEWIPVDEQSWTDPIRQSDFFNEHAEEKIFNFFGN